MKAQDYLSDAEEVWLNTSHRFSTHRSDALLETKQHNNNNSSLYDCFRNNLQIYLNPLCLSHN